MLEIDQVSVSFEHTQALSNITITAHRERVTAVMGPSGCGKTTLLRVVAGLETPDTGSVIWDGRTLDGLRPDQRRIGLMFQDHALFPHRNVFGNVAFGLEMQKLETSESRDRVAAGLTWGGM